MKEAELRELDVWIAVNVFGWLYGIGKSGKQCFWPPDCNTEKKRNKWIYGISVPSFTTDTAAAMQVLEKCITGHTSIAINHGTTGWWVADCDKKKFWATGETLSLAICQFAKNLFSK